MDGPAPTSSHDAPASASLPPHADDEELLEEAEENEGKVKVGHPVPQGHGHTPAASSPPSVSYAHLTCNNYLFVLNTFLYKFISVRLFCDRCQTLTTPGE